MVELTKLVGINLNGEIAEKLTEITKIIVSKHRNNIDTLIKIIEKSNTHQAGSTTKLKLHITSSRGPTHEKNICVRESKKRSNKKFTITKMIDVNSIDLSNYIATKIITIDGKEFLIDQNNMVFDTSDNTLLGRKMVNDIYEWF